MPASSEISHAIARLDELTRRLRTECPWDREQDERSIVPHTVEEAYELADAANAGDDAKLLDELGDVLFQVHFLSLLLEERGAGDLAAVAEHCRQKLIRRHPHVFGDVEQEGRPQQDQPHQSAGPDAPPSILTSGDVLRNWDAVKATEAGREAGIFGEVPENLPALLYARKIQRRADSAGLLELAHGNQARAERARAERTAGRREDDFHDVGERLFAAVDEARRLRVDPELALRAAAQRYRDRLGGQAVQSPQGDP
ncbi:MAG: nucleoside triphosphate pyrophosphohydrolase [Solirubrobacterales bacterium]|nr:nucleoside triphosphate pyrophosphohydrolase [Solirubrobacterales bacterium]